MTEDNTAQADLRQRISQALARHDGTARQSTEFEIVAAEWIEIGFDDAEEVADWLAARCFAPALARRLDEAGITPEQARLLTTEGRRDYADTVAYKLSQNDLTIEEARRIITSDFWNS
ncbi:MAG: hypothetical protein LC742_01510 [Acidobacteria bacterium]|nr:hypothetical protein [Acidobacteriota bacterium]